VSAQLVSAIVANWNGARDLEICLPSLLGQSYRPLEIIVVDNASTDDSAVVARKFDVRWVGLDRNRGLAGALNEGANVAQGEFVLFLNNDMRFHQKFVEALVSQIERDAGIFSADALQHDWEGANQVHLATRLGNRYRANSNCYACVPGLYVYQESSASPTTIPLACAASMLVRKSMFHSLGGFDRRLPVGYEDLELCWRAWVQGWKSIFVPHAVCWHRVGWSARSSEGAGIRFRGTVGGRLLIATKLLPVNYTIRTLLAACAGLLVDVAAMRWQRVRDRAEVLIQYAQSFLQLVRERRAIYRSQRITPREQLERMLRLACEERSPLWASTEPLPATVYGSAASSDIK